MTMAVKVISNIDDPRLMLGVLEVEGGAVRPASDSLRKVADALAEKVVAGSFEIQEDKRRAIRQLLKIGGFSPSGRNRPAQELLVKDLKERGAFNYINNVVDVNNVVSLESMLPISIFDTAKLKGDVIVRIARESEGYVFNQSGQYMDLKRCIVCCHGGGDGQCIGSPVKDSMETKIFEGASGFLAVIYCSTEAYNRDDLFEMTGKMASLLCQETSGNLVYSATIPS